MTSFDSLQPLIRHLAKTARCKLGDDADRLQIAQCAAWEACLTYDRNFGEPLEEVVRRAVYRELNRESYREREWRRLCSYSEDRAGGYAYDSTGLPR